MTKMRKISRIPAAIENVPKVVKMVMNAFPCSSAISRPSCFSGSTSSPSGASVGASRSTTSSLTFTPDAASPRFETSTCSIWPGLPSSFCAIASGASTAAPSVPAPSKSTTALTLRGAERAELVGSLRVHVDLAGFEVGERNRLTRGADRRKVGEGGWVAGEEGHPRLVLAARLVLQGDGLDDGWGDGVDQRRARRRLSHALVCRLVDVGDLGRLRNRNRFDLCALDGDELVGGAKRVHDRRADGRAHRVPGR
jgi:hypothetical protein